MAYYIWGPRDAGSAKILIAINGEESNYRRDFGSVEKAAMLGTRYSIPHEHVPVFLCRDPKQPLSELWPHAKIYQ